MQKRQNSIPGYLYPLDGLRAISVILIFIYHAWLQAWIFYRLQLTEKFTLFDLTIFQQYGNLAIDFFFVLSGFGLFYPIARSMFGETEFHGWKNYFLRRLRRIYPGYILALAVFLLLPNAIYITYDKTDSLLFAKNIIANVLLIHNFTPDRFSPILSTAWMLPIEAQFYILFPLLCIPFRKKPVVTFIGMTVFSIVIRLLYICYGGISTAQVWPICYFDVFGCGMLAAYCVVYTRNKMKHADTMKPFMTAMSAICIFIIIFFFKWIRNAHFPDGLDGFTYFRFLYRSVMDFAAAGFLFTACFSYDFWQKKIWGNRFFIFLSSISYTVYLWHQNVFIFLKNNGIPYTTETPVMNDRAAMEGLTFLCAAISIIAAALITKFVEQPIAKYGYKGYFKNIYAFFKEKPEKKAP